MLYLKNIYLHISIVVSIIEQRDCAVKCWKYGDNFQFHAPRCQVLELHSAGRFESRSMDVSSSHKILIRSPSLCQAYVGVYSVRSGYQSTNIVFADVDAFWTYFLDSLSIWIFSARLYFWASRVLGTLLLISQTGSDPINDILALKPSVRLSSSFCLAHLDCLDARKSPWTEYLSSVAGWLLHCQTLW